MLVELQGLPRQPGFRPGDALWGVFAGFAPSELSGYPSARVTMGQGVNDMRGFPGMIGSRLPSVRPMTYNGELLTSAGYPYMRHIGRGVIVAGSPTTGTAGLRFSGSSWHPITLGSFSKRNMLTNGEGWCLLTPDSGATALETFDYGISWASITLPFGSLVYNQGCWNRLTAMTLDYGNNKGSLTRDGGRSWAVVTVNSAQNWRGVAGLPNGEAWIIASATTTGGYSPDFGRTWSAFTWPTTPSTFCYLETVGDSVYWNPMATNAQYLYRNRGGGSGWERTTFIGGDFAGGKPWLTSGTLQIPQIIHGIYWSLDSASRILWASDDGLNFRPAVGLGSMIEFMYGIDGRGAYGLGGGQWYWIDF